MNRRNVILGGGLASAIALVALAQARLEAIASTQTVRAPIFQVDPYWPKPLPNQWILGTVIGVAVDAQDNVYIVHRGVTGVEAGGEGIEGTRHAVRLTDSASARTGILHGMFSYILQDGDGQIANTHSVSAGLDYSGVGPEHAYLREAGRVTYTYAKDDEAVNAFKLLSQTEGIIPALESSHAVAYAIKRAPELGKDATMIVNISGRGDKDIFHVADYLGMSI